MGTAEAAKILKRAGAGRRRCHTGSVASASVDALGCRLSAVAVGQRICGRACTYGNDHRRVDGCRVRQALGNDNAITLSVLVCASRDVDGQSIVGKRDCLTDDTPGFYADMAKAFLEDADAADGKAYLYWDCIADK